MDCMRARNYVLIAKLLSSNRSSGTLAMKGERQRCHTKQVGNFNRTLEQCNIYNLVLQDQTHIMTKCLHADPKYPPETYDKTIEKDS